MTFYKNEKQNEKVVNLCILVYTTSQRTRKYEYILVWQEGTPRGVQLRIPFTQSFNHVAVTEKSSLYTLCAGLAFEIPYYICGIEFAVRRVTQALRARQCRAALQQDLSSCDARGNSHWTILYKITFKSPIAGIKCNGQLFPSKDKNNRVILEAILFQTNQFPRVSLYNNFFRRIIGTVESIKK